MESKPTLDRMASVDFGQFMDEYVAAVSVLVALVAIPPNAWTLYKVIRWRRFHLNRNVIWLGTGVNNIFLVLCHLVDVGALYCTNATARAILPYLSWVPDINFFTQYVLSMVHRYLCTRHADFYRRHVTVKRIVSSQITAVMIIFLLMKMRFIFGSFALAYSEEIVNTTLVGICTVLAGIFFLLAYFSLPKNIRNVEENRVVYSRRSLPNSNRPADAHFGEIADPPVVDTIAESSVDDVTISRPPPSFVMINNQRVSQFDLDAARNAAISDMISLIFFSPSVVCYFFWDSCLQSYPLNGSNRYLDECRLYGLAFYYSRLFAILAHCVFNPLFFARHRRDKIATPSK